MVVRYGVRLLSRVISMNESDIEADESGIDTNGTEQCDVCEGEIPDEYDKFDDDAPVYADDYVVHLGCEDELFEWSIQAETEHEGGAE